MVRFSIAFALLSLPSALAAQADLCPDGQPAVVRVSKIIPGGSMAGFMEAARDHATWYKSHGFKTVQFVAPILVYNPATRSMMQSKTEVMTIRTGSADVPREKQDAAWAAFVAKYRANSTISSETRACFPKTLP